MSSHASALERGGRRPPLTRCCHGLRGIVGSEAEAGGLGQRGEVLEIPLEFLKASRSRRVAESAPLVFDSRRLHHLPRARKGFPENRRCRFLGPSEQVVMFGRNDRDWRTQRTVGGDRAISQGACSAPVHGPHGRGGLRGDGVSSGAGPRMASRNDQQGSARAGKWCGVHRWSSRCYRAQACGGSLAPLAGGYSRPGRQSESDRRSIPYPPAVHTHERGRGSTTASRDEGLPGRGAAV